MKYQLWDQKAETVSRDELHADQTQKIMKMVHHIYENVPFYTQAFDALGILPGDIKSIDDLSKLPFTVKGDLRVNYPKKMFAVGDEDVIRIHASSGTTGKPTVVGYTRDDISLWSDLMARSIVCAGGTKHSVIQNALGYGLFTGGLGFHYGAERLGAQVIPISGGNTEKQIMIMMDFQCDMLVATPSYAMHLAEVLEEKGFGPNDIPLKFAPLGAEPWTEEMRNQIERKLGIKAVNSFGMSELIGPGVAMECLDQQGMHIWEDHFVPEIIDPDTGEVLPDGMTGELVVTAMTKECLPLLRYRTRDIARLEKSVCSCGRTMARIQRLTGRTDDMLIIRGVNVFPSQIEGILLETEGASPNYQLVLSTHNNMTNLEVKVEVLPEYFNDDITRLSSMSEKIGNKIKTFIGISVKVSIMEPKTLPRSEGKAVRIIDNRNK